MTHLARSPHWTEVRLPLQVRGVKPGPTVPVPGFEPGTSRSGGGRSSAELYRRVTVAFPLTLTGSNRRLGRRCGARLGAELRTRGFVIISTWTLAT